MIFGDFEILVKFLDTSEINENKMIVLLIYGGIN